MPKKAKTGKGRLDKYYHLAKDQGYRARSAFKLIQLAKKHDFLSQARVCIDLCAAPGGWSQVAQRNMPSGSIILAVDLVPIKPIHGVTCIQSDITSDKCRSLLRKEMKGQPADIVLHDGAPNVGASWAKDAFGQAELTLHSLKLACEHLRAGGTFVTKVFRSSDYNSLLWVFGQLFNKVDATKPTASRSVSAEIFVMCIGFKAGKIEPKFFDPKWVFMETLDKPEEKEKKTTSATLTEHFKSDKRKHRSGYEEGDDNRIVAAHDFVASANPAEVLITSHKINLDATGSEELAAHPTTTGEIREICQDLKVCGKGELSVLLKWRMKIVRERERAQRAEQKAKDKQALAVKTASVGRATPAQEAGAAAPSEVRSGDAAAAAAAAAGKAAAAEAAGVLQGDVDDAISALLDEGTAEAKPEADGEDSVDDSAVEEELDRDLADLVEKRRREEKREAKKTMVRQKKQEFRKKMSLGNAKAEVDQPELFKSSKRNIRALEDQDKYIDPRTLDSDRDDSEAGGDAQESDSDSDEGLDKLARMEVDLAVDHQLRKARLEDKCRTKMQRVQKKKKETRRERVMAAWAGEMGAFNEAIDRKAAEDYALKDKDSDEDDEADDDSEDDLKALRDFQLSQKSAQKVGGGAGGMDPVALEALAAGPSGSGGPGRAPTAEPGAEDDEDEAVAAPKLKRSKTGEAIVPAEQTEEALRAEARAERWFGQDIFQGLTPSSGSRALAPADDGGSEASDHGSDPEDFAVVASQMKELSDNQLPNMPLTDKQKRQLKRKRDAERKGKCKEEEDNRPMEIAPLEAPKPLVPLKNQKPSDPQELAETLALGSLMVDSKKSRMDLIDAAYNRWTFDADSGLPDWFTEDENKHNKPELPISKELMAQFRAKLREINARPIRKVAEAKNRKRRRLQKRLEKLRSTAMSLADVGDMSEVAKARQMRKAISKAARADERKVQVVAIQKGGGGRSQTKGKVPKGAKVKVVDRRLKSDRRGEKKAAAFNKRRQRTLNKKQNRKKQAKGGGGGNRESGGRGVYTRGSA